jgi:DNA primase
MEVKIVLLPDNLDPDDYINKFSEKALFDYINTQWVDTIEFNYRKNNMNIDFTKMLDIEHFKKTIFDLIKNSSNTIIESYIKRLANDTSISIESIRQDFNQYTKRNIKNIAEKYRPNVSITSKYEIAEQRIITYFLDDINYLKRYRSEFGPVFSIKEPAFELQMIIEDIYLEQERNEEDTVNIYEKFIENLNEAQVNFYMAKCSNKELEIIKQEFEDLIVVLNEYQEILQRNILEEKIKEAPTIQEKIKLAEYRDIKIKEDKHGQR